jgi:hypothetical protein
VKDVGKLKPRLRCATGDQIDAARPYQSRVVQSATKMFHESRRKKNSVDGTLKTIVTTFTRPPGRWMWYRC